MKIDPDCLRTLRQQKGLSRSQLAKGSGITVRTIRRLENEPQRSQKSRGDTLNRLAKALSVELGVLTGELPLPESDRVPADNPDRVQIGAQIAPKVRLAYDLIKRRYGVSTTEIINMAPLFFALLAEGSLARRREKLQEANDEAIKRLSQMHDEIGHRIFGVVADYANDAYTLEKESIDKADLFGDYLFDDHGYTINELFDEPFDSTKENPFAHYLRKLADELDILSVVDVDGGDLSFGSPPKFPNYDICGEELKCIANGSLDAKTALETGCARLSEIPKELMAEDAGEERAKWLEDKLPDFFKKISEKENLLVEFVATSPEGDEMKELLENAPKTNRETEKEGDDQ